MSTPTEPAAAPRTEAQIRADLEATRAALAASVDDLYEQLQPTAIVANTKAAAAEAIAGARKSVRDTAAAAREGDSEAIKRIGIAVGATLVAIGLLAFAWSRRRR